MYADEIALSGSHLYAAWCERMGIISEERSPAEHVRRVPVAGGSAALLARSTPTKPSQVAVDNGPCHIARVPKRREEVSVIWSGQSARSVSADDEVLCFTQSASVSCMPANGGRVTVVAESDRQPQRVAVLDGVVYWTEIDGMHRK